MKTCLPLVVVALSFGLCQLAASEKEPFEVLTAEAGDSGIFRGTHQYCFRGGRISLEDAKQAVRRIIVAGNDVPRKGRFVLDGFYSDDDVETDPFTLDVPEAEVKMEPREVYVIYIAKTQKLKLRKIIAVEKAADRLIFRIDADIDATKLFEVLKLLARSHFADETLVVKAVSMRKHHYAVMPSKADD